ncbi:MAG: hypothetical protein AAF800_12815, partial [Planctomycetota bacterium]
MSEPKRRVLVFGAAEADDHPAAEALRDRYDVVRVASMDEAMAALRGEDFHAVFADVGDFLPLERALVGDQSSLVLNTIGEGVCIIDADGRMTWSN